MKFFNLSFFVMILITSLFLACPKKPIPGDGTTEAVGEQTQKQKEEEEKLIKALAAETGQTEDQVKALLATGGGKSAAQEALTKAETYREKLFQSYSDFKTEKGEEGNPVDVNEDVKIAKARLEVAKEARKIARQAVSMWVISELKDTNFEKTPLSDDEKGKLKAELTTLLAESKKASDEVEVFLIGAGGQDKDKLEAKLTELKTKLDEITKRRVALNKDLKLKTPKPAKGAKKGAKKTS